MKVTNNIHIINLYIFVVWNVGSEKSFQMVLKLKQGASGHLWHSSKLLLWDIGVVLEVSRSQREVKLHA